MGIDFAPLYDPRRASILREAASKHEAEAARLYAEVPVMKKATKELASVSYMLWTLCLVLVGLCAIIPVWLLVLLGGFGYMVVASAAQRPASSAYQQAEAMMLQAKEAREQADRCRSSESTSDDMGASRN